MKIITSQPLTFTANDNLTPEDLNSVWTSASAKIVDSADKRYVKSTLTLPFVIDVETPYTDALTTEQRTYRFTCPTTCVVERGFLSGNLTSSADVAVNITISSGGATPTGCTVPYLSTGGAIASALVDTSDINVDKFQLVAGTQYSIIVSSTAAFSLERFDVVLHVTVDRWTVAGSTVLPDFLPALLTDANFCDAVAISSRNSSLATEAGRFASALSAPSPSLFVRHAFLSGTSINLRRFALPLLDSARGVCRITRVYLVVTMAATGGTAVTCTVRNAALTSQAALSANVSGVLVQSVDSGAINVPLEGGAGVTATTASDFSIEFANSSGAVSCLKAYALVWLARG